MSAWQRRQTVRWVCELRAAKALDTGGQAPLEAALAACEKVR